MTDGFEPCRDAADLFFRWGAAWGGTLLLGTEGLGITLFNGGYPLCNVDFDVVGQNDAGREVFRVQTSLPELPRGVETMAEIPSYELPDEAASRLIVSLASAEFGLET